MLQTGRSSCGAVIVLRVEAQVRIDLESYLVASWRNHHTDSPTYLLRELHMFTN